MKKMMVLAVTLMLVLTGCGNTKAEEAGVTVTDMVFGLGNEVAECESFEEQCMYSEYDIFCAKAVTIQSIEDNWEESGIPNEDCKDEIIDLILSVEYDPTYECGYDLDRLEIGYVNILVKYDVLPDECYGMTFDEADAL